MPSLSNSNSTMDNANKSSLINAMLLRAWRERWDDAQWGTHIKSVLPKGVSGDAYDLADNILQQAVVGSDANKLVLSYLRHSLCSRQVSHAAVIKRISKFDGFDRPYCIIALLDFIESIMNGVTCRTKKEETSLPGALFELLHWLTQVFLVVLETQFNNDQFISSQHQQILNILQKLLEKMIGNSFIVAHIFVEKQENSVLLKEIHEKLSNIKNKLNNHKCSTLARVKSIEMLFNKLINVKLNGEILERNSALLDEQIESITYCLQPYIAVNVLLHPNCSTQSYASHLQMIQQLKNYPMSRVYSELIRSALISLHNVSNENDISRESMWYAFTFIRVPHIIKHLICSKNELHQLEYSPDVVKALEALIDDPTLDYLDTMCTCNTIEYLLKELNKHNLITAQHVQQFASQRDPVMLSLSKMDLGHQPSSVIEQLKKAESPLNGILKALDNDYNKMQEPAMLGMLCGLLSGNNFELILSVATMEGQLKMFVSRLIRWNEKSKQMIAEANDTTSALFDVTFLMLTFIVQIYGSHVVLDGNGESFFEKWVRDFMIEKSKNKSAMNMVHQCEQNKVDEFLTSISSNDGSMSRAVNLRCHEVCLILPGVLYQLLVAWENDTISAADVKVHIENIKSRLCTYSICAASWLCSYMQIVRDDELFKPLNMIQQFVQITTINDELKTINNFRERLNLTNQIIRKMQTDAHQNQKVRSPMLNIVSNQPLEEQFHEVWRTVSSRGWLSVKATQVLDNLLNSCGPYWLVSKMVNEVLYCKFSKDISKSMDIVFAVMHLNIQKCTITLLTDLLPMILLNKTQQFELIEPQLSVLARLCVYCIMSSLEKSSSNKIKRSINANDLSDERPAKVRKMDDSLLEILSDGQERLESVTNGNNDSMSSTLKIHEPLKSCLQDLFQTLYKLTFSSDLTPKVLFVHQFLTFLHRCGGETIMPILNIIPSGLMRNLVRITNGTSYNYDFILRMHDVSSEAGRKNVVADLSLLQSIQLQTQNCIQF